ncbi:Flagellar biosynthesis protein FlhA [Acidisarcina polymorpha]|uniref:Flagellar biosynthesis protein FlhA n=1 Tax=Acidisarcina polymorpha TaxID=2211140 RepID=A0A2Z5FS02_9BACT|nr:Flagellar biosynthesis protein FlhA [Acidisarcina polymorpha]
MSTVALPAAASTPTLSRPATPAANPPETSAALNDVTSGLSTPAARSTVFGSWPQRLLKSSRDLVLPIAAISVVFVMLVPMPAVLLDVLLALSMAAAVLVFLSAVQVRRAVDFSVFPTLLLLLTLFRLSLNIASSRRILLHGGEGTAAAGSVIEAFGQFVVGGNYVA